MQRLKDKFAIACASALLLWTASLAVAYGDQGSDPQPQAANTDHADPTAKTLPSHASDAAKANAFGQEGARQKAAQAARKAAKAAAQTEAAQHAASPTLPAQATAGRSHAQDAVGGGSAGQSGSPGQAGLDRAAAHRTTTPTHGPAR